MVTGAKIQTVAVRTYAISSKRDRAMTILSTTPGLGLYQAVCAKAAVVADALPTFPERPSA